jgi:hypothetical protein
MAKIVIIGIDRYLVAMSPPEFNAAFQTDNPVEGGTATVVAKTGVIDHLRSSLSKADQLVTSLETALGAGK